MFAMFLVYLASNVQGLITLLGTISFISGAMVALWLFFFGISGGEAAPSPFKSKTGKWLIAICLMCSFTATLLPRERTVYLMAGAYMGQTMLQSEAGQKIGKIVNKKLENYLEDLEKSVESKPVVKKIKE